MDAEAAGVRFLSRATHNRYLTDVDEAVVTMESAARMVANPVPHMTWAAHNAAGYEF